ncbi:MAG: hypothetical protein LCH86_09895 [Proteobacteria bacterium]|nr:hypothetical protein [Pseudomonadota bacterium]
MRFIIRDETVHAAFDMLEANAHAAAVAKAMRERTEDDRKAARARVFLKATGTVAEREAQALISDEYQQACEHFYAAVEADEEHRNQRGKCEAIIEAWRTCQSNFRAMGKVAA